MGWQDGSDGTNAWDVLKTKGAPFLSATLHDHNPLHDAMSIAGDIRAAMVWVRREKARDVIFGQQTRSSCRRDQFNHPEKSSFSL